MIRPLLPPPVYDLYEIHMLIKDFSEDSLVVLEFSDEDRGSDCKDCGYGGIT